MDFTAVYVVGQQMRSLSFRGGERYAIEKAFCCCWWKVVKNFPLLLIATACEEEGSRFQLSSRSMGDLDRFELGGSQVESITYDSS